MSVMTNLEVRKPTPGSTRTEKLRVMVVNDHLGWNDQQVHGVTRLFELWVSYLPRDRYEIVVCILNHASALGRGLKERGGRVIYLPKGKYDPTTALALARLVRRERIDILHLQGYRGMAFGKIAAAMTGVPTVIHFHDTSTNYPLVQRVSDLVLGRFGSVHLAVSESVRACWAARAHLPVEDVRVLYNCASLSEFREPSLQDIEESRRRLGIPEGAKVVGSVTRLFPGKGTRVLIKAASRVFEKCPDAFFLIVGDGPLRADLEAMVAAAGLSKRFRFLGYLERIGSVLTAFDVKVLTSCLDEGGSPLTVLEAMSLAKPIIVTDKVEILEDGVTGLVIPSGDADLLADRIITVLSNTELSSRLGRAAREAAAEFDVMRYVEKLGRIYDSLV